MRLAWLPVLVFGLAVLVLWQMDMRESHESPLAMLGLNLVFSALPALLIAYLMGRSFLYRATPGPLLVGCGALAWGMAGFFGGVASLFRDAAGFSANTLVTVHNTSVWVGALCHLAGTALSLRWKTSLASLRLWLALAYGATLGTVGFIALAAQTDWIPVFFVPGVGGTPLRHFVLGSSIAMLMLTLLLLRAASPPRWPSFAFWYSPALALLAVGLAGVMLQKETGSLLGWAGRMSQYCGGVYMLAAALAALREDKHGPDWLSHASCETRHGYAVAVALVAAAALVRLVFLQSLGYNVAFITFYPAVIVAALYGGFRPGLLATLLSVVLSRYFWMEPAGQITLDSQANALAIAVFLLSCMMICTITEAMHRAQARALRAEALARPGGDLGQIEQVLRQRERRLADEQLKALFPVNVVFPATLAILALLTWLAYQYMDAMQKSDRWEEQTYQTVHQLCQLRAALAEAESALDAYLVTTEAKYQETYNKASARASRQLASLQGLPSDDPVGQRAQALTVPFRQALAELGQVIAIQQTLGFAAAQQRMAANGGWALRESLRSQVESLQEEALRLLKQHGAERNEEGAALIRTGGMGVLFSMGLLSLVFLALRREIAERASAERELATHRDRLEVLVRERTADLEHEIAGHRAAERALLDNEERLKLVLQASAMGTFEINLEGDGGYWNPVEFQLLGLEPGEANPGPDTLFRFVHPDDKDRLISQWAQALRTGLFDAEFRVIRTDGEVRWLAGRGRFAAADDPGNTGPQRFLGVNYDITERKRAEDRLLRSEAALARAQTIANIGSWEWDLPSGEVHWSDQMFRLFGEEPHAWLASYDGFLDRIHPDDRQRVDDVFHEALAHGKPVSVEYKIQSRQGGLRTILAQAEVELDCDGGITRVIGTCLDITERKEAEIERAQLAAIVESSQDAIIGKDLDGRVTSWNRGAEELFGYKASEMLGRPISILTPPALIDQENQILSQICQGLSLAHFETERLHKDGSLVFVSITVSPVKDASGKIIGASKIARDITARRRTEEERDRYISLVKNSSEFIGMCDLQGVPFFLNEAGAKLVGIDGQEQVSKIPVQEFFFPEDQAFIVEKFLPSTLQGPAEVEVRFRHFKTGEAIWMIYSVFALRDMTGRPSGYATVSRDITERKRAEDALRQERLFLRQVLDATPSLIFVKDREGRFLLGNEALARGYGTTAADLVGTRDADFNPNPEEVANFLRDDREVLDSGKAKLIPQERVSLADGETRWFSTVKIPLPEPDGRFEKLLGVATDITERKRAEEALHEADRRKDEFLAMLAHELRNPLTPIMVAAQMLQRQGGTDSNLVKWAGDTVKHQCDNLTQLVNQLLDISRVNQGKITLRKAAIDLRELLGRAVESSKPFIDQHHHELVISRPQEAMLAEVDAVRIEQVLGNLLNNAAKYTPQGGTIWLSLERESGAAVFRVRDSGIGISAAMLPKVFDLFAQAERTLDRAQGGLGIGLALVKSLVEMHGGSVKASSKGIDAGSAFEVRLPLLDQAPAEAEAASQVSTQAFAKACRLLVVDDNDDVRESMALLLRAMGHAVWEAGSGLDALQIARQTPLDAVLLDIGMPGLNGYEVARLLRKDPALAGLTLIALTGYSQEGDKQKSLLAGFDHHLVKPFDPAELAGLLGQKG